mmetsp:Transcript_11459/g.32517  ORF Transcript_11459/g.32517 Transcript_11459/m.32517 type:complete len:298 (+) Transcript_11459:219-1112(+)|eukprot:CAMPEP_0117664484 /NCGR_PEP_ID=MMETSP0804-20121206/9245_1 /TAXON_ID=1074897 /ORGANISM="Tetraselmis astigmatica, Strain CCMP880" /LENGTH=297 /DNA_ID=CAMNT_0005471721 /DNA_START=674 /DNA_END=1567 /DNA_ORIENTATION=-
MATRCAQQRVPPKLQLLMLLATAGAAASQAVDQTEGATTQRFVILGAGRTGSNLFVHTLREHPQVLVHKEVFNSAVGRGTQYLDHRVRASFIHGQASSARSPRHRREQPDKFLEYVWTHVHYSNETAKAVGFKIFPGQLSESLVKKLLLDDESIKIIVLIREDVVAVLASREAASQSRSWAGTVTEKPFTVREANVRAWGREYLRWYEFLTSELEQSQRPYLLVSYEQLDSDLLGVMRDITQFLGVAPGTSFLPATNRQMVRPLEEMVINYDQMLAVMEEAGVPRRLRFPVVAGEQR